MLTVYGWDQVDWIGVTSDYDLLLFGLYSDLWHVKDLLCVQY